MAFKIYTKTGDKRLKTYDLTTMRYYVLFGLLVLLSLAASKNRVKYFPVDEIKAGQHLDQAKQKTFNEFFEWRMSPTNKKWSPCDILHTTDSFIYFGHVVEAKAGFFSKVQTDEVMTRFPLSLAVDGDSVRNIVENFFKQKYPGRQQWYLDAPTAYQDNGVLVKFSCEVKNPVWYNDNRSKILTDSLLLSKIDLSIIQ